MNCQIIMFEIQSPDGCDIFVRNVKYAVSQIIVQNLFSNLRRKTLYVFLFYRYFDSLQTKRHIKPDDNGCVIILNMRYMGDFHFSVYQKTYLSSPQKE